MGLGFWGVWGFRVFGFWGFGVWGLGFWGLGFRVLGVWGFGIWGSTRNPYKKVLPHSRGNLPYSVPTHQTLDLKGGIRDCCKVEWIIALSFAVLLVGRWGMTRVLFILPGKQLSNLNTYPNLLSLSSVL